MKHLICLALLIQSTVVSSLELVKDYPENCASTGYISGTGMAYDVKEAMTDLITKAEKAGADTIRIDRLDISEIIPEHTEVRQIIGYTIWANTYNCQRK